MLTTFPKFDVEIGNTLLSKVGLLGLVRSIIISKDSDKVKMRGKRRAMINRCDLTIDNPDGQIDNILRLGRKLKVWIGYEDHPLIRVGVYFVENPRWVYTENSVPQVQIRALAGDVRMLYSKVGVAFRNVTHTGAARAMAERHGLAFVGPEAGVKTTLIKGASETDWEALERWAYDIGYETWVDDTTDPNTLHFEPITEAELATFEGQRLTIGWGPNTSATLPCQRLTIEHRYAISLGRGNLRTASGKAYVIDTDGAFTVNPTVASSKTTKSRTVETVVHSPSTTPPGSMLSKLTGAQASGSPGKVLEAVFTPGIPFFKLGQVIPLVERGDLSGPYRIVSVTHELNESGYTTRIRAVKGGVAKASKRPPATAKAYVMDTDGNFTVDPTTVPVNRTPNRPRPGFPAPE